MRRRISRRGFGTVLTAVAGMFVVLVAPLATSGTAGANVMISGAQTVTDQVSVNFQPPGQGARTTDVHLLAFNDLHGSLEAAGNNIYGQFAGGAAYLAKAVKDRQARYGPNQITVFAGDNIGASPLANSLFNEEPITIATNLMKADFGSVGNHEFDKGSTELRRIDAGGCKPDTGCTGAPYAQLNGRSTNRYPGASFQYLSANVTVDATGQTLFPAFGARHFWTGSRPFGIGVIGEVLKETPTIVTPTGVAGLTFGDEAEAANKAARNLKFWGIDTSVLVIHQGGSQQAPAALNGCTGNLAGSDILKIVEKLDPSIKVIVSGHTHSEYRCLVTTNGVTRLITSAASSGRILTDITLSVDSRTGELVSASADNVVVANALNTPGPGVVRQPDPSKEDPAVAAVVQQYVTASAPLANQVVGRIQGDLTRAASPFGETTLGNVIADSQLLATQPAALGGAEVAFMNPGGVRADLKVSDISAGGEQPGEVTYAEAFTVQPFGNSLVTKTMTGDMLRRLLQQQFPGCRGQATARILQVSSTFRYEQAPGAATCEAKIGRMFVDGAEVGPADSFRITMNNFLATGGDGFTTFSEGDDVLGGAQDIDALIAYFGTAAPAGIAVPPLDRIVARP
jgi:5'-nucleotidase